MTDSVISQTDLPDVPLLFRGKVRDIYDLGQQLLIVATDRISAFDAILPTPIPDKGTVLTQMSAFWFQRTADIAPNHCVSIDPATYPPSLQSHRSLLDGRSMLVRRAQRVDIECVVRGYLAGSAWSEYTRSQTVCGQRLPRGLRQSDRLSEPIFTPATKAASGHDVNISVDRMAALIGRDLTDRIQAVITNIYENAHEFALSRGLIVADTKLEVGLIDGELIVIDEMLTPDSSRFWDAEQYDPGRSQPSYDKQYVRDWLETSGWDKLGPPPALPTDVVERTRQKYREAYRRLVGSPPSWRIS